MPKKFIPIDKDYLTQWGYDEQNITAKEFRTLGSGNSVDSLPSSPINIPYHSPFDYISLTDVFQVSDKTGYPQFDAAAYYAMCEVESPLEQDIAVLTDGDDNLKVWVNEKEIYRKTDNTPNFRNNGINAVHLKKGLNKFLVKTFNLGGGSSFYVSLSPISYAKPIYLNKRNGDFIMKNLLKKGEEVAISLNKQFFKQTDSLKLVIKNVLDSVILDKKFAFDKNILKLKVPLADNHAYMAKLYAGNDSISQQLFVGDTSKYVKMFKKQYASLIADRLDKNLNPMVIRYDYLNSFAKENGYDFSIERKVVYCIYEMEGMARRIDQNKEAFKNIPGLHMRSYISKVDGQHQYYMIYIPESYNSKKPIPMVVEMPWIANVHRHFLKGWRVADFKRVNMIIRQANLFGYAFLWSCSRTYNEANYSPLATTSSLEEISSVRKNYNIDTTKLYLFGSCLGGGIAVMCASRNPNLFAALGVEGPALDNVPLEPLENFKTLPLYIAHSEIDKKANFKISYAMADNIKQHGGNVTFINLKKLRRDYDVNFYPEELILHNIFTFFRDKRRTFLPDTLHYTTKGNKYSNTHSWLRLNEVITGKTSSISGVIKKNNEIKIDQNNVSAYDINLTGLKLDLTKKLRVYENNKLVFDQLLNGRVLSFGNKKFSEEKNKYTEGPVNDAFGSGFVIVAGSGGDKKQNESIARYVQSLSDAWLKAFNDSCHVIKDRDLTAKDLQNKNLILVGTEATNSVFKTFAGRIPLKTDHNSISIGKRNFKGSGLVGCFIYPNPANKKHYILIITANDLNALEEFLMVPWYGGLKDYYVYQNGGEIDSGFFSQDWQ